MTASCTVIELLTDWHPPMDSHCSLWLSNIGVGKELLLQHELGISPGDLITHPALNHYCSPSAPRDGSFRSMSGRIHLRFPQLSPVDHPLALPLKYQAHTTKTNSRPGSLHPGTWVHPTPQRPFVLCGGARSARFRGGRA